ncbi:GNAT family N-acetyltransferase [Rummeliibacillus sp. JY-2-4R]
MTKVIESAVCFIELKWDTEFFGITSAKAVLNNTLSLKEWEELRGKSKSYQFVSIINQYSNPTNAQLIGKDTQAFLADVNIQFSKKLVASQEKPENITFHQGLEKNNQIVELADFSFSKFIEDPEFAKRGGEKVYKQWLLNAFIKTDKYFALSKNKNGDINGFILYSYNSDRCIIELIAVSPKEANGGIGTKLFRAIEYKAKQHGSKEINVGTQIRNIGAINFYHKVGCRQTECHQVYHLWNLDI